MQKSRIYKFIILFGMWILLVVSLGCMKPYVPQKYPIEKGATPNFTSSKPIAIFNAIKDTPKEVVIGYDIYKGDLSAYTQTAVQVLKDELDKKNIRVVDEATKKLKLEVTKVSLFQPYMDVWRSTVVLKAETGLGYSKEYEGINNAYLLYTRSLDGAITRAVTAMLNDTNIINYISK